MGRMYILDAQGEPEPCDDVMRWSEWFERDERRIVRQQTFPTPLGKDASVSTVFLGLDHGWQGGLKPLLWETMCWLGGEALDAQWRYRSREDAIEGHNRVVAEWGGPVLE